MYTTAASENSRRCPSKQLGCGGVLGAATAPPMASSSSVGRSHSGARRNPCETRTIQYCPEPATSSGCGHCSPTPLGPTCCRSYRSVSAWRGSGPQGAGEADARCETRDASYHLSRETSAARCERRGDSRSAVICLLASRLCVSHLGRVLASRISDLATQSVQTQSRISAGSSNRSRVYSTISRIRESHVAISSRRFALSGIAYLSASDAS